MGKSTKTITTPLEQHLYAALKRISQYQSAERLLKHSAGDWGLDSGQEALEYAYENVLFEAKRAVKGLRVQRARP